jgi:hypothetical protein
VTARWAAHSLKYEKESDEISATGGHRVLSPVDVNDVLCQQRQYIQLFTTAEPFDYWAFRQSSGLLPAVYFSVWLGCADKQPSPSAGSLAENRLASLVLVCWLYCRK